MALTQEARNKIKSFVQAAKKLLMKEFESQLQQFYGIRPDGTCLLVEELTTREASVIETARLLRQRLHYLEESIADENKAQEAVRQLIREQAFTILNRFAAIRMSEERNIIQESIRKGYNSEGFLVFDQLTGGAKTADQFTRYKWYIGHVFDELSIDLPAVFDRFSPYALLFPSERVMLDLMSIINDEDLNIYREKGHQPINLWIEDETIGWIYQYYNSREEISEMRDASGAPRNSRELAVRNQFFTPRYVVQFLVDNSLGRQWYEMTKGKTALVDLCQYMVKQKKEIFLEKGEQIPETKSEEAHYIEFRKLKDPREILMLDPACGSMHFGLYSFDLFEQIYIEAWDNHPELLTDLRDKYLREDYIKQIAGFILRYNIHGVDIDPRALQIAGLSLWLRAQKSYDKLNLQPVERPAINKSNLVLAEPMPGDKQLLSEITKNLPGPIGKLVRVIWEKMQLAGETGLLLKIEEELKKEIEIARKEYKEFKNSSAQTTLYDSPAESKTAQMAAIFGKGQKITKDFFDKAEEEVLKALKNFAENAEGEDAFQKLLFAEDTARGFAFIELCRRRYDVIVMNPPFGESSVGAVDYLKLNYSNWAKNILSCFFYRSELMLNPTGMYGVLFDRTASIKSSYEKFRNDCMVGKICFLADTGWGVLDANVETTVQILAPKEVNEGFFIDLRESKQKEVDLLGGVKNKRFIKVSSTSFDKLPNKIIGYYLKNFVLKLFETKQSLKRIGFSAMFGSSIPPEPFMRLFWELNSSSKYKLYYNGGGTFSQFYSPFYELMKFGENGYNVLYHKSTNLRNIDKAFNQTIGYGKRGEILDAHFIPSNILFSGEGHTFYFPKNSGINDKLYVLSLLNSSYSQYTLNQYTGQHKSNGYINLLPAIGIDINTSYAKEIIKIKKKWSSIDETNLNYKNILLKYVRDLGVYKAISYFEESFVNDNELIESLIKKNDLQFLNCSTFDEKDKSTISNYSKKRPNEKLITISEILNGSKFSKKNFIYECLQNLIGLVFSRWQLIFHDFDWLDEISENELLEENQKNHSHHSKSYSVSFIENNELSRFAKNYHQSIFLPIFDELESISENSTENFLGQTNLFFQYHLNRYTKSRRIAPIYWPISTKSNSYVVWIYYPALSESTLFSIVNELVDPKIKEIAKEVEVLEINGSSKELHDQKEFLAELEDFKEELLRVAQLPYKPNQDDGVLITAAPLHNLFQHNKWKKATKDCWKKLEKGEFDWSHLAYSIWPDRVRKKCKKDLSMAIAHSLEDICEVKPKEKKDKNTKEIKPSSQLNLK